MVKVLDVFVEILLILLLVLSPVIYASIQPFVTSLVEIIAAVLFFMTAVLAAGRGTVRVGSTPLMWGIIFLLGIAALQLIFPLLGITGRFVLGSVCLWSTHNEFLKILSAFFIFFTVLNGVRSQTQMVRLLAFVIGTGALMALFYLVRHLGMPAPQGFVNKDHYSGYLGMIVCASLGFLFVPASSARDEDRSSPHLLIFFVAVLMAAALFVTQSRGGMFSFMAGLALMAFLSLVKKPLRKKAWIFILSCAGIVLTLLWIGITPILQRIMTIPVEVTSRYFGGRVPIWQAACGIIRDYPVFGSGFGTFTNLFSNYELGREYFHYDHAHCDFLEFTAESGFVGLMILGFCCVVYVSRVFRSFRGRRDPFVLAVSTGLIGALTALFVHSWMDFSLRIPAQLILAATFLALLLNTLDLGREKEAVSREIRFGRSFLVRVLFCIGIFLGVAGLAFAAGRVGLADLHFRAGKRLWASGAPRSAINSLHKAIQLDPHNPKLYAYIGRIYIKGSEDKNAIKAFKTAISLDRHNANYFHSLAGLYARWTQDDQLARFCFEEAIRLEPRNPYRYQTYAAWMLKSDPTKRSQALSIWRKAVALNPQLKKGFLDFSKRVNGGADR